MWAETRNNLASGTLGDPTSISTLILFWSVMENFHYPGAAQIKAQLMEQSVSFDNSPTEAIQLDQEGGV